MCVREPDSADWTAPPGLTFRDWLRDGGSGTLRAPTSEDLDYHLSTLFPPVRPRGHMELRMIDAQPGDGWIVPAAVATALADDERAADAALAAAEPVWDAAGQRSDAPRPVAARGQVAARPTRISAGPAGSASRRPTRRWAGRARPPRSGRRWPTSPNGTCCKTDVRPTTNWMESHDGVSARAGIPARDRGGLGDRPPGEALREVIARELAGARQRTALLTDSVDEADLVRQHSPLMSPLVWDLAHIANQEELWLLREVGGREPMHPEIDPLYDAFEHPALGAPDAAAAASCAGAGLRPRGTRAGCSTCWSGPGSGSTAARGCSATGSRSA